MKKVSYFLVIMSIIFLSLPSAFAGFAPEAGEVADTATFTIARLLIAGSVQDKEPVGIVDVFAASTEKVYCFLEARDIKEDTQVSFIWFYEESQKAKVTLPIHSGSRWRTFSSKKLGGMKGVWTVELQDIDGTVLQTIQFTVE